MHEMQTIVTDVRGVCQSVRPSVSLSVCHAAQLGGRRVQGSFGAASAKRIWRLVLIVSHLIPSSVLVLVEYCCCCFR